MSRPASALPEMAYAAALATLDGLGPRTLFGFLRTASPAEVWSRLRQGSLAGGAAWRSAAVRTDVAAVWGSLRQHGVQAAWVGAPAYPDGLTDDRDAPGVIFHRGDLATVGPFPRVAVVGTRSATRYGLGVAAQLGADLAAGGVSVVSGLALGIDGAAHEGACAGHRAAGERGGPPVAVVAGGLDRPYPPSHAGLTTRVARSGVVLSTAPIGTPVERWRFPHRNRLLAALSDVVVVVEAHHAGGALSTARAAEARGVLVGAVPGSIRSPASAGTNDLLADGCFPVRDVTDVRAALGLMLAGGPRAARAARTAPTPLGAAAGTRAAGAPRPAQSSGSRAPAGAGPGDSARSAPGGGGPASRVLEAIGAERCSVEDLLRRTALDLPTLCTVLEELAATGRLVGEGGWWETA
jgi:DNA processing protein